MRPSPVFHDALLPILAALVAVSYALVLGLGAHGLLVMTPLWIVLLPVLLKPLGEAVRRERFGVLFLFLIAGSADTLDNVLGVNQRVSTLTLVAGAIYLLQRSRITMAVLRAPVTVIFGVFLLQQVVNALALGGPDLFHLASNRMSVLLALVTMAVVMRTEDGERLAPAVVILATVMSVPVMMRELSDPELLLPYTTMSHANILAEAARAGGLFGQANNGGTALTFAMALTLALPLERRAQAVLLGAVGVGVLCTGSRGAFAIYLALLAVIALRSLVRSGNRVAILAFASCFAVLAVVRTWVGALLIRLTSGLEGTVPAIARLQEVLLAFTGSTDALVEDDSRRLGLAEEAVRMIAEKPLFGYGTGNFVVFNDLRSHIQFLEILGENGALGALFYGAFLAALSFALVRIPRALRWGAVLVAGTWLFTHFDKHTMFEYRFMVLPLGYLCGLDPHSAADDSDDGHPDEVLDPELDPKTPPPDAGVASARG